MDNDEYAKIHQRIMIYASLLVELPLEEFLEQIDQEGIVPIIDPTVYQTVKTQNKIEDIARALHTAKQAIKKVAGVEEDLINETA